MKANHALWLILVLSAATSAVAETDSEIQATFRKYRHALIIGDGEAAWSILDTRTTDFYSKVVVDAVKLPKSELDKLGFTHKFTILKLRHEFRKAELERLSGHEFFVTAIT